MNSTKRLALAAGLLSTALLFMGCPDDPVTAPPDGGGSGSSCLEDGDCGNTSLFYCDPNTSKCAPGCRVKEDCSDAVRGADKLDFCSGSLGCQCDDGQCVASQCSADVDCGALACRNGACVAIPAASEAAKCQITPDFVVTSQGSKVQFWVSFWTAGNQPVVLKDGITWAPAAPLGGTGSGTTSTLDVTGNNSAAATALTITAGSASCTAKVLALAPVAANTLRVTVTDELTGRPVKDAKIVLSQPDSSAVIGTVQTTTADGAASFSTTGAPASVNVSAFHADYSYLTVTSYAHAAGSRDLSLVVRRNQTDKYGGYKGTFTNLPATSNIQAGIAGMSIAGSVTDLSITQLLGPSVPTDVKIGTILDQQDVPLPAGTYLRYNNPIKDSFSAQGLAGVCWDANGTPDESAISTGTCGTRTGWALAGDVPIGEISGAAGSVTGGVNNINYGQLLSQIIPVFKRFNSSVARDVKYSLKATPGAGNGNPDFSDTASFTVQDQDFQQTPLSFNFLVNAPSLPKFKGTYVDGLILLGGVVVPGRGVVPLGLGVGVNTKVPVDDKTDEQTGFAPGLINMRMAPAHNGLEGSQYGLIALAASLKSATDATAGLATSAIFERLPGNKLVFDNKGTDPSLRTSLTGPFLPIPEGAKYNFTDASQGALTGRTFKFTAAGATTGASVVRVNFTDRLEHRWTVLMAPTASSFTLPNAPAGLDDRTYSGGAKGPNNFRSLMVVQTLKLSDAGTAVSYTDLVENNGTNADRLLDFTTAFAVLDYNRPDVEWITPDAATTSIQPLSAVKVQVRHFKIGTNGGNGDEGTLQVSCSTGQSVIGDADTSAGKGEITVTLPAGCTGANTTLKAELLGLDGNPVAPPVSAQITVNIQ